VLYEKCLAEHDTYPKKKKKAIRSVDDCFERNRELSTWWVFNELGAIYNNQSLDQISVVGVESTRQVLATRDGECAKRTAKVTLPNLDQMLLSKTLPACSMFNPLMTSLTFGAEVLLLEKSIKPWGCASCQTPARSRPP
jgi:hypothetical protein